MKTNQYLALAGYFWIAWALFWFYSSRKVKTEIFHQGPLERVLHLGKLVLAFLLLFAGPIYVGVFSAQLWPANQLTGILGLVISLGGVLWMIWARLHLGANWSAHVSLKQDHELIQSGPYQITRHPIYTGFILAILGDTIIVGQVRGLIALIIVIYTFSAKMRLEEEILKKQFPNQYSQYAMRVKRLIPFIFLQ